MISTFKVLSNSSKIWAVLLWASFNCLFNQIVIVLVVRMMCDCGLYAGLLGYVMGFWVLFHLLSLQAGTLVSWSKQVWAEIWVHVPPGPTDAASVNTESSAEPPCSCCVGIATQLPADSTETTRKVVPTSTVSHLLTSTYRLMVTSDSRVKIISMLASLTLVDDEGGYWIALTCTALFHCVATFWGQSFSLSLAQLLRAIWGG